MPRMKNADATTDSMEDAAPRARIFPRAAPAGCGAVCAGRRTGGRRADRRGNPQNRRPCRPACRVRTGSARRSPGFCRRNRYVQASTVSIIWPPCRWGGAEAPAAIAGAGDGRQGKSACVAPGALLIGREAMDASASIVNDSRPKPAAAVTGPACCRALPRLDLRATRAAPRMPLAGRLKRGLGLAQNLW